LGFLVGALVLGTAFPHFLKLSIGNVSWNYVIIITSSLAVLGGFMIWFFVPDGPHRKAGQIVDFTAFFRVFRNNKFRAAALGYFGHMWELYAFWAFVPIILVTYNEIHPSSNLNVALFSFVIIAMGTLGCILGGYISLYVGVKRMAFAGLTISFICCLFSIFIFKIDDPILFIIFLCIWGFFVVADSPLFSTLVAQNAILEIKGTALTIVNSIGFAISIVSIQLLSYLQSMTDSKVIYTLLALGPLLGLIALSRND